MPWFMKRNDKSNVNLKLDETEVKSLIQKHGEDFMKKLSFDETNELLLSLGFNPYPPLTIARRPLRWMLKLEYDKQKKEKNNLCSNQWQDQLDKCRIDIENHRTVEILDKYNRMMFIDLEREARAI